MSRPTNPSPLAISLAAYMTESGASYSFHVGEKLAFALRFRPLEPLKRVKRGRRSLTRVSGAQYTATGRSRYSIGQYWVVDFGFPAFALIWPKAPAPKPGRLFDGTIELHMDPGDYHFDLSRFPSSPPLRFDWEIVDMEIWNSATGATQKAQNVPDIDYPDECIIHCMCLNEEPQT